MLQLQRLAEVLPEGVPVPAAWLEHGGWSRALLHAYARRGHLTALGGAYLRPGPPMTWEAAVYGAQQTGLIVHVGHLTALAAHGLKHYLTLNGQEEIHLYLPGRSPTWLRRLPFAWRWHHGILFDEDGPIGDASPNLREASRDVVAASKLGVTLSRRAPWPLVISTPERAALELAADLTHGGSWDAAYETFEGLTNLRPDLVQTLLEACRVIVAKRVFLHLAETANLAWLRRLDLARLDLGSGKRSVVPGGRLDPVYQITVPRKDTALEF